MKVLYVTGTRADYGLMEHVLEKIRERFELEIVATGMHMMEEFGNTISQIKFPEVIKIDLHYERDEKESMAKFLGNLTVKLTDVVSKIKPDIILIIGDRPEMLAAAIVGTYLSIPVAHVHGGEVTGNSDEIVRHAITKLSSIHFAATEKSAERIRKMGEKPELVFVTGAPGLDEINNTELLTKEKTFEKLGLVNKETALIIQHPSTIDYEKGGEQIEQTLKAVAVLGLQTVVIYPNADAGGRKMIEAIKKYKCSAFKSIERMLFLSLMKHVDVMIGNSSSGIIEAPSLNTPVVNIGTRQLGRETASNIINVDHDKDQIIAGIKKALSKEFARSIKDCKNPYGDGRAAERIINILGNIKIDNKLLQKQWVDERWY